MTLSLLPQPKNIALKHNIIRKIFPKLAQATATRQRSLTVLWLCLFIFLGSGYFASWVKIGEPEPGSPLLFHDHDFNIVCTIGFVEGECEVESPAT